jgi:hypothetical protein
MELKSSIKQFGRTNELEEVRAWIFKDLRFMAPQIFAKIGQNSLSNKKLGLGVRVIGLPDLPAVGCGLHRVRS